MTTTIEMEVDRHRSVNIAAIHSLTSTSSTLASNFYKETYLTKAEQKPWNSSILYKLKLRFLCGDDIIILKKLCNEWFPIKYPDSWYRHVTYDKKFYSLVATLDGNIVGLLIAEIKPLWQVSKEDDDLLGSSFAQDTKVAYILSLGVCKPFRRQGVASFLLHNFMSSTSTCSQESLICQEVKAIYLHVLSSNKTAIQFYERHKFRLLHFLPAYYVIDSIPKDGYSYVLHINGGKPSCSCLDYCYKCVAALKYLQLYKLPTKLLFSLCKIVNCMLSWSHLSPFVSKTRQYHNL